MGAPRRWRRREALALTVGLALTLAACSADNGGDHGAGDGSASVAANGDLVVNGETIASRDILDAARKEGRLTLYTTQVDAEQKALDEAFTADTGIDVEFFRDGGASLTQRILTEAAGGVHNVDVIVLTSPFDMASLDQHGLLSPSKPTTLGDHLAATGEVGPGDKWYPNSLTLFVIGVNRGVVGKASVKTWTDVVAPAYKGQLGITPAGIGGSGLAQAAFEKEVLGPDYWQQLGAVRPVISDSTTTVAKNLASGDISVAIAGEPALRPLVEAGGPIELVYPEQGVIGIVGYQAVAKQSAHPAAAQLYHNWLLSKRGQEMQSTKSHTRSIRDDVDDPGMKPARSGITVWMSNLTGRRDTADRLIKDWNTAVGYRG